MTLTDDIQTVLEDHVGPDEAITSSEIIEQVGIDDGNGNPNVRGRITELIEAGEPIAASPKGYYYIEDEQQLNEYVARLDSRIAGIRKRIDRVTRAYDP